MYYIISYNTKGETIHKKYKNHVKHRTHKIENKNTKQEKKHTNNIIKHKTSN
jgi:hypothetical protein